MLFFISASLIAAAFCCNALLVRRVDDVSTANKFLFITGDSYTTTGFNITAKPRPSRKHPLGNPAYPGATLSGGENWIDIVVNRSAQDNANHTIAYDVAVGANTVNISRTQLPDSIAPKPITDMIDQVDELERLFKDEIRPNFRLRPKKSLSINWFGINDIFWNGLYSDRNFTTAQPYLAADVGDYYGQLGRLYDLGARQFMTILVPPINRTNVMHNNPKAPLASNLTDFWNEQIRAQGVDFLAEYDEASHTIFDPSPVFNEILDDYAEYGAPNDYCDDPSQGCLWHDFIHPGVIIQTKLGERTLEVLQSMGFF